MYFSHLDSPIGDLLLTGTEAGLTGVYPEGHVRRPGGPGIRDDRTLRGAAEQLAEFFAGERVAFELPLAPVGTEFQRRVWQLLLEIPFGQRRTYRSLAVELGSPNFARAVGLANGRNPISIVVPCHRVVGSDGALTGYAAGLATKQWLLQHEATVVAAA